MVEIYDKYNNKIYESDNIEDAKSDVMRYIYTHYKYGAFPKQEYVKKLDDNNFDYFIKVGYLVNYNQTNPREFNFLFKII